MADRRAGNRGPRFALLCLLLGAGLIFACGDDEDSSSGFPPLPTLGLEEAFPGLRFDRPTGMYELPDGSGRFVVLEQVGRVQLVQGTEQVVYLDLVDRISSRGSINSEEGLLGLAFAPDFVASGELYIYRTAPEPYRVVLSRFQVDAATDRPNPASEEVLLEVEEPFWNHNGGQISFGPDGYLYVGIGDGGFGGEPDPFNNAQNRAVLLGKILRLDVAGGGPGYRIPGDNPFVGDASARPEIWAYGLRNPWRFSFDPATGDLWAGDAGHERREEIDQILPGANYGWKLMEGNRCLEGGCDREGLVPPVVDYGHDGGNCAVIGGFVYRGAAIPALDGVYLYGDFCSGRIWGLRYQAGEVVQRKQLLDTELALSSFAIDSQGNLYVVDRGSRRVPGAIYKIVAAD